MPTPLKTFVPLSLLALGVSTGAAVVLTQPGGAAVPELTYSANAEAQAWHLSSFDQDMSGDPVSLDLAVGRAAGALGSDLNPRSSAVAANLGGAPAPAGLQEARSEATATSQPAVSSTKSASAGSIPNTLSYETAILSSRGRWAGDDQCVATDTPITTSTALSNGAATAPAPIPAGTPNPFPIPLPTEIPTEIPTILPTDFPTGLPTDLPSPTIPTILPTLPTDSLPTLPTLPTDSLPTLPTDSLPTLPTSTLTLPTGITTILPFPKAAAVDAAGDAVSMATVASTKLEESTGIQDFGTVGDKKVVAQAVGTVVNTAAPAMTFFGGEVTLTVTSPATLVAYSTGTANGSQVEWTPPTMILSAGGTDVAVPVDGSALTVSSAENSAVKLTVSAGHLNSAESADGTLAQGAVNALDLVIKNGDKTVLEGAFMPLLAKATSPVGGVKCPTVVPQQDPKLKLSGKSNGTKADKLAVSAIKKAKGARVTVYTLTHHKLHKVGQGTLDKRGRHAFTVKDKNGAKATVYVVKLKGTAVTLPAQAKRKLK